MQSSCLELEDGEKELWEQGCREVAKSKKREEEWREKGCREVE